METQGKIPVEIVDVVKPIKSAIETFTGEKTKEITIVVEFEGLKQMMVLRFAGSELE